MFYLYHCINRYDTEYHTFVFVTVEESLIYVLKSKSPCVFTFDTCLYMINCYLIHTATMYTLNTVSSLVAHLFVFWTCTRKIQLFVYSVLVFDPFHLVYYNSLQEYSPIPWSLSDWSIVILLVCVVTCRRYVCEVIYGWLFLCIYLL